jgi:uncharacterized membrane protein YgcG
MYCVRYRVKRVTSCLRLLSAATAAGALMFVPAQGGAAFAQSAEQQTTQPPDQAGTSLPAPDAASATPGAVTGLIAANAAKPDTICPAISPVITATPVAFAELVEASKTYPDLLEPLGECCAVIQKSLKKDNPDGAKTVSSILVSGPPAIQAACAVSLAEDTGGATSGQTTAVASSSGSGDGGAGTSGVGFGGGSGGSGTFGGGGGTVSSASP